MTRDFVQQKVKALEAEVEKHQTEAENHRANAEDAEWQAEKAEAALTAWQEMLAAMDTAALTASPVSQAEMALALPDVTLAQALEDAARFLGTFTKGDIVDRIKLRHSKLEFATKSLDKPLHALIDSGRIVKIKESAGHNPAVYKLQ